jgi:serine/threonine protein kinase/Tol biopolymer transport system component
MSITSGTKLGPYEILSAIGAGGMGEVYKAHDTRLNRTVAIKVLPSHFSDNTEMKARFDREAQTIAGLNHPHICVLHDVGHQDGTDYLVMEYLEGQTLAQRLEKGPLPLDQVLQYAIEIADALDKAHRRSVTHRDLKPGNIMLTKAGTKLLDFGLAKLRQATGKPAPLSQLSTVGEPITAQSSIMGTLQYMAPEQLEGGEADARTDIFAFGAVVYEMATGRKAFEGKSQASLIAKILQSDAPSISSLQPMAPPALDRLVKHCLAKDPDDRWQSARDIRLELELTADRDRPPLVSTSTSVLPRRSRLVWGAAVALLLAIIALLALRPAAIPESHVSRFSIVPAENTAFIGGYAAPFLALSPDGRRLAFVPTPIGGRTLLWVRNFDSITSQPLAGTDGAVFPFWSPDGHLIAFFADGKLKTIESRGGIPHVICDAPDSRGGAWSRDGVIVFTPQLDGPLYRVPASGGQPVPTTALDVSRVEVSHRLPNFLPDGRHFLFFAQSGKPENNVAYIGSLDSKETSRLNIVGSKAIYAAGFILFTRDQSLMAQPFDLSRLKLYGEPVALGDRVAFRSAVAGDSPFSVADSGALAYWSGGQSITHPTWFDRKGQVLGTIGQADDHFSVALSPDERQVATETVDPATQTQTIWLVNATSGVRSRLTADLSANWAPLWSPDGERLAFGSLRSGPSNLYEKAATGVGAEDLLMKSPDWLGPTDWSSDGRLIVLQDMTKFRLAALSLTGERKLSMLQSESVEADGHLSPDGKWLAYTSNASGSWDIYVQPFPSRDRRWRVSPDGGSRPRWRRDGKELYYVGLDQKLMSVAIKGDTAFTYGPPAALFQLQIIPTPPTQGRQQYAVAGNGDRFLVNTIVQPAIPTPVTIVLNWQSGLSAREKR